MSLAAMYYSTLVTATVPLGTTINRIIAQGSRYGAGTVTVEPTLILTPSGGQPPYTYTWTRVSGDVFGFSVPSAAAASFFIYLGNGDYRTAVYQGTVTDANLNSVSISATIIAYSQPTGGGITRPIFVTPYTSPDGIGSYSEARQQGRRELL